MPITSLLVALRCQIVHNNVALGCVGNVQRAMFSGPASVPVSVAGSPGDRLAIGQLLAGAIDR